MGRELRDLSGKSESELAPLAADVSNHETLEDVFRWVRGLGIHDGTEDLIKQDEFTHDAIFPYRDGLYLVYGLT